MRSPTAYRFRQYRLADDGNRYLVWASTVGEIPLGDVPQGSRREALLVAEQEWLPNTLVDEGEQDILDVYFRGATAPTSFYGRLYNDTIVETDTLASLVGEVSGTGYPGTNTIERSTVGWPTLSLQAGDYRVDSKTLTWTNTGATAWSAATTFVLATAASGTAGKLLAFRDLSATRTLQPNDQLQASIRLSLA